MARQKSAKRDGYQHCQKLGTICRNNNFVACENASKYSNNPMDREKIGKSK